MLEPDFMDLLAEQRLNELSGEENIFSEEEVIKEIAEIFGNDMDLNCKTNLALFADKLKDGAKTIYEKGVEDGIRLAKRVCGN